MMMRGVTLFGSKPRTSKGKVTPTPGRATSPAALPAKGAAGAPKPAPRPLARSEGGTAPTPTRRASPPSAAPTQPVLRVFPDYEVYEGPKPGRQQQQQQGQALPPPKQDPISRASSAPHTHTPPRKEPVVTLPDGEKGLENNQGEYNCFINVVIQALWHLPAFRERFVSGAAGHEHHCLGQSCVHCALQTIFLQYQFSEQSIIPPTVLRQALAALYKDEARFQMNQIDDAAEALEAILNRLHHTERAQKEKHADPGQLERKACPCLVHNTFGVRTMDLLRCDTCAATTEPKATGLFVAYAYTYALREARQKAGSENYSFCQFFQKAAQEDRRWCPNADRCNRMCVIEHHLLYLPKVFSVGLVWPSADGAPVKEIEEVMDMITMQIDMSNIFITNTAIGRYLHREKEKQQRAADDSSEHQLMKDSLLGSGVFDGLISTTETSSGDTKGRRRRVKCVYELRGMICYYGQHYNSYFRSTATNQWYVFDDVMVNAVGSDWASVKARCLRGHLQPSVLFYEKKEVVEVEEDECSSSSTVQPGQSGPEPSAPAYDALFAHAESKAKATMPLFESTTAIAAPSLAPPMVDLKPRPQPATDGMDALKRTIEAGILEMLLQGEEQWKKEREQERLAASRLVVDKPPPQPQPSSQPEEVHLAVREESHEEPIDRENNHQDRDQHDPEDGQQALEEDEQEEKKDDMNGSWFVRRMPENDQADSENSDIDRNIDGAEPLPEEEEEEEEEEETAPRHRTRRPSLRLSAVTAPPPSYEPEEEEEDSEWELVGGDEDEVEIIHHDVVRDRSPHRPHVVEAADVDDGDGGLDDGDDGYLGLEEEQGEQERQKRQKRRTRSFSNSFTMLERQHNGADEEDEDDEEGKASVSLDGSFTLLDPHDGNRRPDYEYVDIEVTGSSWLYRRRTRLYRLTAEAMLRIEPVSQACQESLRYEQMVSIQLYGMTSAAIRYFTTAGSCEQSSGGADGVHYVEGEGAAEVALELCRRCPQISLTRHHQQQQG